MGVPSINNLGLKYVFSVLFCFPLPFPFLQFHWVDRCPWICVPCADRKGLNWIRLFLEKLPVPWEGKARVSPLLKRSTLTEFASIHPLLPSLLLPSILPPASTWISFVEELTDRAPEKKILPCSYTVSSKQISRCVDGKTEPRGVAQPCRADRQQVLGINPNPDPQNQPHLIQNKRQS